MIIYRATKKQFVCDVFNDTIADNIDNAFVEHLGRHTSPNEVRSWHNSMQYMYKVVNIPELPDEVGVAIEYQIPLTAKRIDFIISSCYNKIAPIDVPKMAKLGKMNNKISILTILIIN